MNYQPEKKENISIGTKENNIDSAMIQKTYLLQPNGKGKLIIERILNQIADKKQDLLWSDYSAHSNWGQQG
jgi:hypothetical protein